MSVGGFELRSIHASSDFSREKENDEKWTIEKIEGGGKKSG